jgi:hypothetical protein
MLIGVSVEPFNIPSPVELILNRLQIMGSQQNGREYLYEAFGSAMNLCTKINSKAPANGMVIGEDLYQ